MALVHVSERGAPAKRKPRDAVSYFVRLKQKSREHHGGPKKLGNTSLLLHLRATKKCNDFDQILISRTTAANHI